MSEQLPLHQASLRDIKPAEVDRWPVFQISGERWIGHNWNFDYRELVHRDDGQTIRIRDCANKLAITIRRKLMGKVLVERNFEADSILAATQFGLTYVWDTVDAAGKTWYLVADCEGFKHWKTAFDKSDSGEIIWRGDHFTIERRISTSNSYFEMKHGGMAFSNSDGRIKTFDDAAQACSSCFSQLLICKGM